MKTNNINRYKFPNFINLAILKRKPDHAEFINLDIGFSLEPGYVVWLNKIKKSISTFRKEFFVSSFFREFSTYNFLFMIFFVGLFFFFFLIQHVNQLNQFIPINLFGNDEFDLLIDKNLLYLTSVTYLIFFFLIIFLFYKYNSRSIKIFLNIYFFYIFFLSIVLFLGIVRYLLYFQV